MKLLRPWTHRRGCRIRQSVPVAAVRYRFFEKLAPNWTASCIHWASAFRVRLAQCCPRHCWLSVVLKLAKPLWGWALQKPPPQLLPQNTPGNTYAGGLSGMVSRHVQQSTASSISGQSGGIGASLGGTMYPNSLGKDGGFPAKGHRFHRHRANQQLHYR